MKQTYGIASKNSLQTCLNSGRPIQVVFKEKDKYGRFVSKVVVGGVDCNINQLNLGSAWHYKAYTKSHFGSDANTYSLTEQKARQNSLGLWGYKNTIAPWDFRKQFK